MDNPVDQEGCLSIAAIATIIAQDDIANADLANAKLGDAERYRTC